MKSSIFKHITILGIFIILFSCNEDDSSILINDEGSIEVEDLTITGEILVLVNQHRQEVGLEALKRNAIADELAIKHTNYMIAQSNISHDDFNLRFQELQQKVNAYSAGENVASGYQDASSVVNGWLNSSGHKANIEGNYTHIGLAAIKDPQGKYYFTQLFYR
jgi:uncharacterized protein YkwD